MDNNCPFIFVGHGRITIVDPDYYAALAALSWHVSTGGYVVWRSNSRNNKRTMQFSTPEEAARARDELAKQIHGEFATLNFNT